MRASVVVSFTPCSEKMKFTLIPLLAFSKPGMRYCCQSDCTFTSPLAYRLIVTVFAACFVAAFDGLDIVAATAAMTTTSAITSIAPRFFRFTGPSFACSTVDDWGSLPT